MTQDQGRPPQEEIAPSTKRKRADAREETKSPKRTKRSKSKQPPPAKNRSSESEAEASDSEEQEEEEKTSAHVGQGKKPPMIGSVNLREEDSLVIHRPQGDITAALIRLVVRSQQYGATPRTVSPPTPWSRLWIELGSSTSYASVENVRKMVSPMPPSLHYQCISHDVPVSQHGGQKSERLLAV